MASSQLIALEAHLAHLKQCLIVERDDYAAYTAEDHTKALSYVLLASAAIEAYVEDRCVAIARVGSDRLFKGQPTSTGRALLIWYVTRNSTRATMIHEDDIQGNIDLYAEALLAFTQMAKSTHGMDSKDMRKLVFPLGIRDAQLPELLLTSVDVLSARRNPAAHSYINRAKSMREPVEELNLVQQIMAPLRTLDADLQAVAETF